MERTADVAVIGGGIVGLAHAYMALKKGLRVVLFEREKFAVGASVRNFGLIWPIGQAPGDGLNWALKSAGHWRDVAAGAGIWCNQNGSLHLAYEEDEVSVLEEFMSIYADADYDCGLITPEAAIKKSPVIKREGLKAALWSNTEMTVYPREAIRKIPLWLQEQKGLMLCYGQTVVEVSKPYVRTSRETWKADRVVICSGADFETLYPHLYDAHNLTKCRLQMMKVFPKTPVTVGPSLCAGLTLRHYAAFSKCPSLAKVDERFDRMNMSLKEHGIHVLVSQNQAGEIIIGDSHHYFQTIEPFDIEKVNELIITELESFVSLGDYDIIERWHGVYPKYKDGIKLLISPEPGIEIVNGLGGAGMTMSFGLAEDNVSKW